jgi:hypothetical protein
VRFVVDNVALGHVFLRVLGLPLSILFHQCPTLFFIYEYMLHLPAGQTGYCWEPRTKKCCFENLGNHEIGIFFSLML